MAEERARILKLLEDGRITAEQAARLIEALGSRRADEEPVPPLRRGFGRQTVPPGLDRIPDIVAKAVSSAVKSRGETASVRMFADSTRLSIKAVSGDVEIAGTGENGISISSDGSPRVRESGGAVEVNAVADDLRVRTARSCDVAVKTVSGDVAVAQLEGAISVLTVSGDVEADEVGGRLEVATVSGDVELTRVAGEVAVKTGSGDIDIVPGGQFGGEATTRSGDITLLLGSGVDLLAEFETEDGDIDVALTVAHEVLLDSRTKKRVRIGAGTRQFRARTVKGSITVRDELEE